MTKKTNHRGANTKNIVHHPSSFRDPAGFIYVDGEDLVRRINAPGLREYDLLMSSGLYTDLRGGELLVKHTELVQEKAGNDQHKVIRPEKIPFISYPFEWSFSQLRDAALLTLKIQKLALKHSMSLKDASAYNVQFLAGKPIFIDTLSFEANTIGEPWQAYRQYCQHFLAPLVLMSYTDGDLSQLSRVYLDGIPLKLAAKLLPLRAKLKPGIAMHITAHSAAQKAKESDRKRPSRKLSRNALIGIIESLESTIKSLKAPKAATEWGDYYENTNYSETAADKKAEIVENLVKKLKPKAVLDLGGNNGQYSRILNAQGIATVCTDIDPVAVEQNYVMSKKSNSTLMLPLLVDLINPGGALGWENRERDTIDVRLACDVVMALALIHHLAISNNVPFGIIAGYFQKFAPYAIVEFVPKSDSQVKKLLSTRRDIFSEYDENHFVDAFLRYYEKVSATPIPKTKRTLYVFKRRSS